MVQQSKIIKYISSFDSIIFTDSLYTLIVNNTFISDPVVNTSSNVDVNSIPLPIFEMNSYYKNLLGSLNLNTTFSSTDDGIYLSFTNTTKINSNSLSIYNGIGNSTYMTNNSVTISKVIPFNNKYFPRYDNFYNLPGIVFVSNLSKIIN